MMASNYSRRGFGEIYNTRDPSAYEGTYIGDQDPIVPESPDESGGLIDGMYDNPEESESGSFDSGDLGGSFLDSFFSDDESNQRPIVIGDEIGSADAGSSDSEYGPISEDLAQSAWVYGREQGIIDHRSGAPADPETAATAVDAIYRDWFIRGYWVGYNDPLPKLTTSPTGTNFSTLGTAPTTSKTVTTPTGATGSTTGTAPAGMSTGAKIAIGVGLAALVGVAAYAAKKKRAKKKAGR